MTIVTKKPSQRWSHARCFDIVNCWRLMLLYKELGASSFDSLARQQSTSLRKKNLELLKMSMKKYPLFGKEVSSKPQLSTIFESDDEEPRKTIAFHGASEAKKEQKCSKMNARDTCSEKLLRNRARFRAGFQVTFTKSHSPRLPPPLIGTPWNVAEFQSITALSSPSLTRRDVFLRPHRTKNEQDCIELWLKFFG